MYLRIFGKINLISNIFLTKIFPKRLTSVTNAWGPKIDIQFVFMENNNASRDILCGKL